MDVGVGNFTITAATGDTHVAGDFDVATTMFTVDGATGDTYIFGGLEVDGTVIDLGDGCTDQLTVNALADFLCDVDVGATNFTIAAATGDTVIQGSLTVYGNTQIGNTPSPGCTDQLTVNAESWFDCVLHPEGDIYKSGAPDLDIGALNNVTISPDAGAAQLTIDSVSPQVNVTNDLRVGGTSNLIGTVTVGAAGLNVGSTLTVSAGGASITGATTIIGNLNMGGNSINITGDIGASGSEVNHGWFDEITVTTLNVPANSIDISDDTNLAVTAPIVLTDDTLSVADVFLLTAGDTMAGTLTLNMLTVASASPLTLGNGNVFDVTGVADITSITAKTAGTVVVLIFSGTAGGTGVTDGSNLILAGDANFVYAPDGTLTLVCDGTDWYEVSRSVN